MEAVKSIKECWKEAWTFPGPRPPHEAKLIDVREDADGGKVISMKCQMEAIFLILIEAGPLL